MLIRARSATFRYRVGCAVQLSDDSASLSAVREFRTLAAAERWQERLAKAGQQAVLQVGVLQWLPHDEAAASMAELVAEGVWVE